MDQTLIHAALTITSIVLIYSILARGLLYATEPFRSRCLDLYERMAKSGRADKVLIAHLDENLDDLYSNWSAWKMAGYLTNAVFIRIPSRKIAEFFGADSKGKFIDQVPDQIRPDLDKFITYWILATVANSPAAALLFVLVGTIGVAFFVPLKMIAKIVSTHTLPFDHRPAH